METKQRAQIYGLLTISGAGLLCLGVIRLVAATAAGATTLQSFAYALIVASATGLTALPFGLRALGASAGSAFATFGTSAFLLGTWGASLADLPAVRDPADTALGASLGPPALLLFSLGLLAWFVALRRADHLAGRLRWVVLLTSLWFFLQLPIQLPLFIIPTGKPSAILLAGVPGFLQMLIGVAIYRGIRQQQGRAEVSRARAAREAAS